MKSTTNIEVKRVCLFCRTEGITEESDECGICGGLLFYITPEAVNKETKIKAIAKEMVEDLLNQASIEQVLIAPLVLDVSYYNNYSHYAAFENVANSVLLQTAWLATTHRKGFGCTRACKLISSENELNTFVEAINERLFLERAMHNVFTSGQDLPAIKVNMPENYKNYENYMGYMV